MGCYLERSLMDSRWVSKAALHDAMRDRGCWISLQLNLLLDLVKGIASDVNFWPLFVLSFSEILLVGCEPILVMRRWKSADAFASSVEYLRCTEVGVSWF
ncbi:hypothetical protein Nepgr_015841 [Nepenthes gracilis]|uniref:Uncharacterized protein n=1 Tax=Nepenthes gracilis TaxID=150966 RepID=A0AAD3SLL9_NEPGR|nr:hypothetical protein Nepgr_015841 [Nepenthes gracilis]